MKNKWFMIISMLFILCGCQNEQVIDNSDTVNRDSESQIEKSIESPSVSHVFDWPGYSDYLVEKDYHKKLGLIQKGERPENFNEEEFANLEPKEDLKEAGLVGDYIKEINFEDLENLDYGLVYIGRASCPYCNILEQKINIINQTLNIPFYVIDTEDTSGEQLISHGVESIPQIYIYKEGTLYAKMPQIALKDYYQPLSELLVLMADVSEGRAEPSIIWNLKETKVNE